MERMTPNRPLTHDLFRKALQTFDIELKEVLINNLLDGIFYSRLICEQKGEVVEIDSRTSDALALAVRFKCPIYTFEFILEAAGVVLDDEGESSEKPPVGETEDTESVEEKSLDQYKSEALEKLLQEALAREDYERAAELRDELNRRKGNES
jgi:uncharacterized protein